MRSAALTLMSLARLNYITQCVMQRTFRLLRTRAQERPWQFQHMN